VTDDGPPAAKKWDAGSGALPSVPAQYFISDNENGPKRGAARLSRSAAPATSNAPIAIITENCQALSNEQYEREKKKIISNVCVDGLYLKGVPEVFQKDKEIVLAACRQNGWGT
jgi:hypothetical protein